MKTRYLFLFILLVLAGGFACNSGGKSTKRSIFQKKATGYAYEVLVVMDKTVWEGEAGRLLYQQLTASIPGLPQHESLMRVTYAEPSQFDGLLRYVRNIIQVRIDSSLYTKVSMKREADVWAQSQEVMTLYAPSTQQMADYLATQGKALVNYFGEKEQERYMAYLQESHSQFVYETLLKHFQVQLFASEELCSFKDTTNFFWTTDHGRNGRTDLVIYSFPYTDKHTFSLDYLVSKRDSVLGEHIQGAFPGSYMTTTKQISPTYEAVPRQGIYCGVVRGLWEMAGDMMGGPFVSYAYLDEKNQRIVVAETFIYAPNTNKAKFIRKGEAALRTLRFEE